MKTIKGRIASAAVRESVASSVDNKTQAPAKTTQAKQRAAQTAQKNAQRIKTKQAVNQSATLPYETQAIAHDDMPAMQVEIGAEHSLKSPLSRSNPRAIKSKSTAAGSVKDSAISSAKSVKATAEPSNTTVTTSVAKSAPKRTIKTRTTSTAKTLQRAVKADARGIKTAAQTAAKAKQAAKVAQKTAQQAARTAKFVAQKTVQMAKVVTKAVVSAIKALVAAMQSLVAALAALGSTVLVVVLVFSLVAVIAGSVLGIFMAAEPNGHGIPVTEVTTVLNEEYYKKISEVQAQIKHDKVEIRASDGVMGVKWEDVLAIYACKVAASDDPTEVVTFDEPKKEVLRGILWDMNAVDYETRVETKYIDIPVRDEDGNQIYNENGEPLVDKEPYTETTLIITVANKTPDEMAAAYHFTPKQYEALALLKESGYASLWATLLGGLVNGSGEIITPDTDWTGTDIFAWPLPQSFRISSPFGYRKDPFSNSIVFHGGTDIAAPFGTPILAAAGGTVTVANATDPWGMSYGYHVKINHGGGQETLYAHASSICVTAGQNVQAGEVIGYVGSTGNSNGNHLHFEVRINGERVNAMGYFK